MNKVLVTGGAGRLGSAIAHRLSQDGWHVVLADLNGDAAHRTAASLLGGAKAEGLQLDVTSIEDVKAKITAHGPFAALVNAAGGRSGMNTGPFTESDPASWRKIIDLHLRGVLNCCYAALPGMIAAKRGAIVSLAAIEGLRGDPNGAVFSAAKAGIIVLTETLVRECRPSGIRVNTILPGHAAALAKTGANDDAEEVADATAFLLSDRAGRTTGACLDVTGGWALH